MSNPQDKHSSQLSRVFSWLKSAALYLALFIIVFQLLDFWRARDLPKEALPELRYQSIDGASLDVNAMSQESITVLYFWATWCGYCKVTSPAIERLAKDVNVVSIAMASGSDEDLKRYQAKRDYSFVVVNDDSQAISQSWKVGVTPFIVMIKNGEVVEYTSGLSSYPGLWLRAKWADFRY
ncbi:protein disulfide oxidoreductase [Agaribacterium sp. ZY112]|uniref:protein disulfide oxidoreductase n=1 Tax=Agaribacterium sp. ZY112 TaxID=3233574 RepID=UPI003525203E